MKNAALHRRPVVTYLFAGLLASTALVGLSASSQRASAATTTGCGAPGSSATLTLKVNGFERTVIVHLPLGSSDTTPFALVLNLHGSGSTALEQEGFTKMNKTANEDGFIVAYPQALIADGTGFDWNVPGVPLIGGRSVPAHAANDVKFLISLVGILEHRYCVNPHEVYATGFSGGARETSQLACDASSVVAAVAPVSGLRRPSPCRSTRAVPIISFHGSADPVDPFAGNGQPYWTYSVPKAERLWAKQDHCTSGPTTSTPASGATLTTYAKCSGGSEVQLYEVLGEGHEWPGGPTMPSSITALLGPQSSAVNANALMWAFFSAHPLPS
ncbi:MAG: PHB depolymerase family esterase [Acidimicrobiales bacterium]